MEWLIVLLLVGGFIWWISSRNRGQPATPVERLSAAPKPPAYEDYEDELERKPIEDLDEEEQIIRRAHDAYQAERFVRTAEYRAKQDALAADKQKIARAVDFIKVSYLDLALPYVQEETQYWPSWIVNQNGKWVPPLPISDLAKGEDGVTVKDKWIELRPEGGPLYRIAFEESRMPVDDDYEYGSMTLCVDGEEVLGMFVKRNWTKEWNHWQFAVVESLKVGPWIDGFIVFYNRLRSIKENKSEDVSTDYVRAKAAKIELGGLG